MPPKRSHSPVKRRLRRALLSLESIPETLMAHALASRSRRSSSAREGHLLIAGPGRGSVGDEAMHQAFSSSVGRPLTVIARGPEDLLDDPASDVSVVYLPDLLYTRSPIRRMRALRDLLRLAASAETISIVGADVMDGVYNEASSVRRFRTAYLCAKLGLDARILGFSWNSEPAAAAVREMKRAAATVTLCLRDGVSLTRLLSQGASRAERVADLAFLTDRAAPLKDAEVLAWLDGEGANSDPIVIVNANPRLASLFGDQWAQYIDLVKNLLAERNRVVLLPHDSRGGERSEETYVQELGAVFADDPRVLLVPHIMMPDQVVALARRATLVVSGRMHLVILASVAGTPSIGLEYQDKFEGLYKMLGYGGVVNAAPEGGWNLSHSALEALARTRESAAAMDKEWPTIHELASRNLPAARSGLVSSTFP